MNTHSRSKNQKNKRFTSLLITLNTRSNVMKHASFLRRGANIAFALFLFLGFAMSQNLNLNGSGNTNLGGTWHVKGNISNASASGTYGFTGTVDLDGTVSQTVGGTSNAINFATLNASGGTSKAWTTSSTVSAALSSSGSGTIVDIGTQTLTLGGTISVSSSGTYDFADPSSEVIYNGSGQQLYGASGFTYGKLTMNGGGAYTMAGDITAVGAVTQSAGSITIGSNFTINTSSSSSFLQISTVSATKSLTNAGVGTTSIATLSANAGNIEATAGSFQFTTAVTNDAGTIYGNGGTLDFNTDIANAGGTIQLASAGSATFAGSFSSVGTLTFPTGTFVTFDGAGPQNVPGVSYGTLSTDGTGTKKTALAAITVLDAFDNGGASDHAVEFDFSTFTHTLPSLANLHNDGATVDFGGTNNGVLFTTGTVDYNAGSGDQILKGDASNHYATLVLSGGGTKTVADADADVTSNAGLTINNGVTLVVEGTRTLTVGYTSGDLNIEDGAGVTNNGVITVGQ